MSARFSVIGAGPAGSLLAIYLARQGHDVVVPRAAGPACFGHQLPGALEDSEPLPVLGLAVDYAFED